MALNGSMFVYATIIIGTHDKTKPLILLSQRLGHWMGRKLGPLTIQSNTNNPKRHIKTTYAVYFDLHGLKHKTVSVKYQTNYENKALVSEWGKTRQWCSIQLMNFFVGLTMMMWYSSHNSLCAKSFIVNPKFPILFICRLLFWAYATSFLRVETSVVYVRLLDNDKSFLHLCFLLTLTPFAKEAKKFSR